MRNGTCAHAAIEASGWVPSMKIDFSFGVAILGECNLTVPRAQHLTGSDEKQQRAAARHLKDFIS
ncbi:MAG: hypothetical protein ACLP1D_01975 [Xanthobacteraceae bacterium]